MSYENPDKPQLTNGNDIRKENHRTAQKLREYATMIDRYEKYVVTYLLVAEFDPSEEQIAICLGTLRDLSEMAESAILNLALAEQKMIRQN